MTVCKVNNMDIVSDPRTVLGILVIYEYSKAYKLTNGNQSDIR